MLLIIYSLHKPELILVQPLQYDWDPPIFLCIIIVIHEMFSTSISKLNSSWCLLGTFESNVGCFSARLLDLGLAYIGLALLTQLFASLTSMIAVLAALITACIITCVILCQLPFLSCFSLGCLVWDCLFSMT